MLSLAGENRNQTILLNYPLDILGIAAMLHGHSMIGFEFQEVIKNGLLFLPGELAGRIAFHVFILKISFISLLSCLPEHQEYACKHDKKAENVEKGLLLLGYLEGNCRNEN